MSRLCWVLPLLFFLVACGPATSSPALLPKPLPAPRQRSPMPQATSPATPAPHTPADTPTVENLPPLPPEVLFLWQQEECNFLRVTAEEVTLGICPSTSRPLPAGRAKAILTQVLAWAETYTSGAANTPAGTIWLGGKGHASIPPVIWREMAEWAQARWNEAIAERGGAAWGAVFTFSREGGIAGFCDTLVIYASGEAIASNCKGQETRFWLTPEEAQQLYAWLDTFAAYEFYYRDPAVADAMTISWSFQGRGSRNVDDTTRQEMQTFLGEVLSRAYR